MSPNYNPPRSPKERGFSGKRFTLMPTTRHPYHRPRNLTGTFAVRTTVEEWPIERHPSLIWRKRRARKIRRKRQMVKAQGIKTFLVPVYIVTTL